MSQHQNCRPCLSSPYFRGTACSPNLPQARLRLSRRENDGGVRCLRAKPITSTARSIPITDSQMRLCFLSGDLDSDLTSFPECLALARARFTAQGCLFPGSTSRTAAEHKPRPVAETSLHFPPTIIWSTVSPPAITTPEATIDVASFSKVTR